MRSIFCSLSGDVDFVLAVVIKEVGLETGLFLQDWGGAGHVIWAETIGLPNLKANTYTSAVGYPAFLGFLALTSILYKKCTICSAFGGESTAKLAI